MESSMVTVFDIDNSEQLTYIRPVTNMLIIKPNTVPNVHNDIILPDHFKITLLQDWDTYEYFVLVKVTGEGFSMMGVRVDKMVLYNLIKEKDSFVMVGEKIFYLENPDLLYYRTDNIPNYNLENSDDYDSDSSEK